MTTTPSKESGRTYLRLTPKQDELFGLVADTKCPNAGFIGGLGSGKTVVGTALTLYLLEKYPGIRILVCAPTYDQLAQGTLMSFMEWCPQNYIAGWNRTEHIIIFLQVGGAVYPPLDDSAADLHGDGRGVQSL